MRACVNSILLQFYVLTNFVIALVTTYVVAVSGHVFMVCV